ncbi:MAG: FHA domain-containing protein, partial [Proteobacteria bacterium]|nr:FHA domain-containing protein [Pseudomonadota bacterium]
MKDLGSSNGTLVNGERIDERELVSGDEIQIGDTKFVYKLVQKDFEDKKQSFLQVPEEPMPDPVAPLMPVETLAPPPAQAFESFASQSMGGVEPAMPPSEDFAAPAEDKRGMIAKALDYYRALPVKMQVIYGGVILFGIYFFMEDDTPPPKAKMEIVQQQKKDVKKDPGQKAPTAPTFELLPPETQKYIESQYKIAFEHYRNHEYDSCLLELGKIFTYVQDYKSAREIESYAKLAKQQIEAAEEERKRKEVERQAQIRLQSLIDQAGLLMDQKKYKEAEAVFPDIELIQPENSQVANWKKKITEEAERAEADRIQREKIAKLRADQWGELHAAEKVLEEKNYFEALDLFDAFLERDSLEPEMVKAANAGIKKAEDSIAAERDPLLAEGKRLEAEGKENDAYRTYQKVLKVDPTDTEAPAGMARIRGALNARAKSIYSEGVIAEGFGDLAGAEKKYLEVLEAYAIDEDDLERLKTSGRRD